MEKSGAGGLGTDDALSLCSSLLRADVLRGDRERGERAHYHRRAWSLGLLGFAKEKETKKP
jgi:hypothetical protein